MVGYNRSLLKSTQHTSNTMVDVLHDPSFLVAVGTLLQFAVSSDEIQQHIVLVLLEGSLVRTVPGGAFVLPHSP